MPKTLDRRGFLKSSAGALGILSMGASLDAMASSRPFLSYRNLKNLGPLRRADPLGLRLPTGFSGRLLAKSGAQVPLFDGRLSTYRWHRAPDGGACFACEDGSWIYTSNSEVERTGGAGALRFAPDGSLVDAYPILQNTNDNCAGGPTPWGSWLSCEETSYGRVFECDIYGIEAPVLCRGLGYFKHEAVTVDPVGQQLYLTEDEKDGRLYRYTPQPSDDGRMDLQSGLLEVASLSGGVRVNWLPVPHPRPKSGERPTREQVPGSMPFNGGEGIWYHEGRVLFTSKGDNRVWAYDTKSQLLSVLYDKATAAKALLSGVDNVVVSSDGHILVAEDGGNMQIVVLGPYGDVYPLLQVVDQSDSEITGPAICPAGQRMYFSSQRGGGQGLTYELTGSFS